MRKKYLSYLFGVLLTVFSTSAQQPTILRNIRDTVECRQWVEGKMRQMTLKQKIGQLFIHTVTPEYTQYNRNMLRNIIDNYEIGGLLFSAGEVEKQVQLTNYVQDISEIPLLITFDGEWGLSMRLKGTPKFPYNRVLGCVSNDSLLYEYGKEIACQCRAIGVHVNFAPVADVDNNPKNPVINYRSFGSSPSRVAEKVTAYAHGLEDGGVLAVCKHFPGHGDTDIDSHKALPELPFDRSRLDSVELYPFRKAVESGVSGIMTGHLRVPALDKKPASISEKIIGVLKDEMHFNGLIFTDALEMKGISGNEDVCAKALIAGNDMVLAPRNLKKEIRGVLAAIRKGELSEDDIDRKCRKVLTFKYALGLSQYKSVPVENIRKELYTDSVNHLQKRLACAAVTVARNSDDMVPLDLSALGTVLLSISSSMTEAHPLYEHLRETMSVNWVHAHADSIAAIRDRIRSAHRIIAAVYTDNITTYNSLLLSLASDKPMTLIYFTNMKTSEKSPELLRNASSVVFAHSAEEYIQKHVADILVGKSCADGKLSIPLAGIFTDGAGVTINPQRPREYSPEDLGMDSSTLARIDSIAEEGIRNGAFPGCHVLILRNGLSVYDKCFGKHTYKGNRQTTENDIYDLASLTKTAATLLAVMKLYDEGRFGLTDRISEYLPYLRNTDKSQITVQDLLFHESGLPAYLPFYEEAIDQKSCKGGLFRKKPDAKHSIKVGTNLYACTDISYKPEWITSDCSAEYPLQVSDNLFIREEFRQEILRKIVETPLKKKSYRYSCLNFMLLKELVETLAKIPMDKYLDSVFYKPMGLLHTSFLPLKKFSKEQIVPTVERDFLRGGILQGFVQDEAAAFMGGVSGNAGLFSTAHDIACIFQMLLDKGVYDSHRYLTRATCELFTSLKAKGSRRGLGFDKPDTEDTQNSPCAAEAPASVFGHTGFTGTAAWTDPDNGLVFIFLCNRTYPTPFERKNLTKLNIRPRMQQAMYQSLIK